MRRRTWAVMYEATRISKSGFCQFWTVLAFAAMCKTILLFLLLFLLMLSAPLTAAEFKSAKECVVGMKVADRANLTGKVLAVEDGTMCRILMDGSGKKTAYLFWMLHPAGASVETNDKLVVGKYDCWVGSQGAGSMKIT